MSDFLSHQEIERLEEEASRLFEGGAFVECESALRRLISECPMKSDYFGRLGRLNQHLGKVDAAEIAFLRERQLKIIEANTKVSPVVDRLEALWARGADGKGVFSVDGFDFSLACSLEDPPGGSLVRVSHCGQALLQVCLFEELLDDFLQETSVLSVLADARCQTSTRLISEGRRQFPHGFVGGSEERHYRIVSYQRADRGGFGYGDLIFALLEQQSLGYYVNDLSVENIRYDSISAVLRFASYSKAIKLSESVSAFGPRDFLDWCRERESDRLSIDSRYSFLLSACSGQDWVWEGSRLKVVSAQIVHVQHQVRVPEPSIQSVDTRALAFEGVIDWKKKATVLDRIPFAAGERALDVGCGMGEGIRYLAGRGCIVTGVDSDARLVSAGQVISNVERQRALFLEHDFDYSPLDGEWDTVLLLSVLHHFAHREAAVQRILACCRKRILIESALVEVGYKWLGRTFRPRPAWDFQDESALVEFFEDTFEGFRMDGDPILSAHGRKLFVLTRKEICGG